MASLRCRLLRLAALWVLVSFAYATINSQFASANTADLDDYFFYSDVDEKSVWSNFHTDMLPPIGLMPHLSAPLSGDFVEVRPLFIAPPFNPSCPSNSRSPPQPA